MTDCTNVAQSISYWSSKSFEEYKEWLEKKIKLNNSSPIFLYQHLKNFTNNYRSTLGITCYFFLEKLFYLCLELKFYPEAKKLLDQMFREFGNEKKIIRMIAEKNEISPDGDINLSFEKYKQLILFNQEDKTSIKRYILFLKFNTTQDNMNEYIELWNEYLKIYMDDPEAWNELGNCYCDICNYEKAAYCFEELLLHNPFNYMTMLKIADIKTSLGGVESCKSALNFYCQAYMIQKTPRALWGMANCLSTIFKTEKKLDEKMQSLVKIVKRELPELYKNSQVKISLDDVYKLP